MMLTIHGLPVMVKYHELKALIKKECNMSDFILDNLVNDLDGYKKVRIGVADETEGSHLTKCLNGYHLGGNVLRVVPLSKPLANQPQSNFDQRGGYIPDQSGNFGNQPMMGNRSTPWGPSGQNQWAPNQQQPNQMPQNNFAYQQGPNNQPFAQQQQPMPQRGQPTPKPFTQTGSYNQNRPTPPFGSANNVSVPVQAQRRNERSHVLRNVELVSEPPRPQTVNRFPQDSYEQNKPITINKDYFQGSSQYDESQQVYSHGPGQTSSWKPPQKPSPFDKGPQFDDKRHEKGRFSPPRGPHDRRPSAGRDLRSPGRRSPGRRSPGRRSPGRRSPGRRPSPGDRRLPPRKSPGRRDSPKRMSPNRRLESPGRRYSPSRRPDKGYDRGSQSKQVRPAYEPDGKAPNQAMYSGGYRPSPHESGPYSGRPNQQNSPWQQDRDKYPGQMKKPDDDRRDSRMAGGARGPEPLEANRPSPMHKSRSPSRRDVRERSPLRDRYKRHSPSPRSPRRSWALEKRRSPELTQAPPPPMWPGQNEEDSYGRDKVEGSKHVPVWDHRTLAETEEAMRRDNRAYADERMRREVASRDAPTRREPSPRRHGFKPHEEVFSAKINTEPKFEPRDPKFLPRESKFDSRDPKFDQRDSKFAPRDPMFNQRDPKYDQRDPKFEPRDPKFDPRAPKFEPRDPKFQPRDPKFEPRDPKFEPRDPKFEPRDPKFEPRDPKFDPREPKFEPRDPKFQPRDPKFEPRDPKFDPRGPKFEPRDPKFEPRDPKFDQRDKFELRDPKFDSREDHFEARDQRKMGPSQQNLDPRGSRFDQPKMEIPGANYDQRDPKYGTRGPIFEPRDPKFEPRGNFELRDKYEHHEPKFESRDPKIEHRGPNYNQHDPKYDSRGSKFEPRDPKFESRELKFEPRDTKFGARDDKFKPTFEPVDPSFREREPVKFEVRDPKHSSRDKFDTRDRKFDPREDFKDRREFPHDDMQDRNNRPDRDNRDYQRPDDRNYRDEPGRREEFSRRDDRKDNRQPQDEFQKEFDDIYKRSLEFKQKVQELRRSERDRGDYGRDDRRREPERDDRRKPDDDDYHRDMERHHDDRSSHRPDDRPRSHDDDGPAPDLRRNMAKKRLPPEVKLKRDKAVENIAGKMMEKYGNFEMDSVMKLRVKDDLQVAIAKILFDMFGTKDISFIEMVVKFNAKHDQRSELKIFEDVMSCFPSHVYKAMKRSAQDSDRSDIPAKTSRFSAPDDPHLKAGPRRPQGPVKEHPPTKSRPVPKQPHPGSAPTKAPPAKKAAPPPASTSDKNQQLDTARSAALEDELHDMMFKVWRTIPAKAATVEENYVIDILRYQVADDVRNILGLNVTKRLLNIFNPLHVKVHFSTKPERKYLRAFLKRYNFVAFKRIAKVSNTFAARVKSIADYDELINTKKIYCGAAKLTITPCYKFSQCPKGLQTKYANPEYETIADELDTAMEVDVPKQDSNKNDGSVPNKPITQDVKEKGIPDNEKVKTVQSDKTVSATKATVEAKTETQTKTVTKTTPVKSDAQKTPVKTATVNKPPQNVNNQTTPVSAPKSTTNQNISKPTPTPPANNQPVSKPTTQTPSDASKQTPKPTAPKPADSQTNVAPKTVSGQATATKDPNSQTTATKPVTTPAKAAISQTTPTQAANQTTATKTPTSQTTVTKTDNNQEAITKTATNQTTATKAPTSQATPTKTADNQAVDTKTGNNQTATHATNNQTTATNAPNSQTTVIKPANSQTATNAPNSQTTVAKAAANQTTAAKAPVSQATVTKPSNSQTAATKPANSQTAATTSANSQTPITKQTKPVPANAKPGQKANVSAVSAKLGQGGYKTPVKPKTGIAKLKNIQAKGTPFKTKATVAKGNVKINKATKPAAKEKKPSYMYKDDFEELDDHDILALISGGIVLDECSGSDVE